MEHPPATVTHAEEYVRLPGELNPGCTRKSRIVQAMLDPRYRIRAKSFNSLRSFHIYFLVILFNNCVKKVVVVVERGPD